MDLIFQVDSLQKYFDALQSDNLNEVEPLDFKGDFIVFNTDLILISVRFELVL